MPTGTSVAYVAGDGHIQIPLATGGYRAAHAPQAPKPTGLDWAAITPACAGCGQRSGELNHADLCPACTGTQTPVEATSTPASTGTRRPKAKRPRVKTVDRRSAHVDRAEIVRLYTGGTSIPKIHDQLGHSSSTIRRVLTAAGVERRDDRANNGPPPRAEQPESTGPRTATGRAQRTDRITLDTDAVVAAYKAGQTLAEIAAEHGCSHPVVARHLDAAGVARRGAPTVVTTELVAQVRRLYLDEQLPQAQVADQLGLTVKVVQNIMAKHDIPARPGAHLGGLPGVDRAVGLKDRIQELGVTARDIKEWALRAGLIYEIAVGLPSARIVAAYAEAHPMQEAS